ncbi:ferrous iron transporter B [Kushneria pakistanensis]|uniref:Ferrous iron transporter B n=1 Tax=Kushneria pakistanensis TaxID=1508770 RepID=A0ABQ3FIR7_9GAMM|nr:fimbria/pilus outer membrane usher protein [Kushneria pakistanensis]GHC25733.1 ferrous iron transporter B [Kushneria pakistanensis]
MRRVVRRRRHWPGFVLCLGVLNGHVLAGELPPPPEAVPDMIMTLELAPVVNGAARGNTIAVRYHQGQATMRREDLINVGVPVPRGDETWLDEGALTDIDVEYDAPRQRLLITVPPEQLEHQYIGAPVRQRPQAQAGRGMLFNYDLYSSHQSDYRYASLWHEARGFGEYGVVSTTGRWWRTLSGMNTGESSYLRHDSWWRYHDPESLHTWQVGDMISGSLPWSRSVRLGGVQFSRNFSLRPDLVTYPLPTFEGTSAVPGTVDLFVNGYRSRSLEVDPGPFTLTDVPYINGAGEAVVVTEDTQGRRVATTVPFYVTSELLEAGLADYELSIGALRRHYGRRSMDYGQPAASGVYRYGLNDTLTLETHGELADGLSLAGAGSVMRLGQLGVLNLAVSGSQHEGDGGWQQSVGYQYTRPGFNVGVQHNRRETGFSDLSGIGLEEAVYGRSSTQATISTALGTLGSVGGGYFDTRSVDDTRTRLVNLSWNRALWQRSNLFVSGNRALDGGQGWSITTQLVISLGQHGTLASGVERLPGEGGSRQRLEYNRPAPVDGGAGWRLGYDRISQGEDYRQAELSWRGDRVETRVGAFGDRDNTTWWGEATGAVVAMDGDVLLSRRINDAFVLVSTEGQVGIPVNYEHRMIGRTDDRGHRLIPWVTPWYQAMVDIDTMELPPDMQAERVRQPVSVRAGSGYLLRFPIRQVRAAGIRLEMPDGEPVALGSMATLADSGLQAPVGYDGLVYFEQLAAREHLRITTPTGQTCEIEITLPEDDNMLHTLGPYRCQPMALEREQALWEKTP